MPSVRPPNRPTPPKQPQRLPQRWAIIAMATTAAGVAAYLAGGPIAAISIAMAVIVTTHGVLE